MRHRPDVLKGRTSRVPTPVGTAFITTNTRRAEPFEVFVVVGKSGSDVAGMSEAVGRLISLILRMEPGLSRIDRIHEVVEQLEDIGGRSLEMHNGVLISSLPDAVAKVLKEEFLHMEEDEETGEGA